LGEEFKEHGIIRSVKEFPYLDQILNPRNPATNTAARCKHSEWIEENESRFNSPQLAIFKLVSNMPERTIELIQGPPGTGKTTVIVGIVQMLLSV
jgi:Cdc6-like AAA superfamily ATPase